VPLACALPPLGAASLGLGSRVPGVVEILGLLSLTGWVVLAQRRLRAAPAPALPEVGLALLGVTAAAVAVISGGVTGFGTADPHPLAHLLRPKALAMVAASLGCFGALAVWPLLAGAYAWVSDVRPPGALPLNPSWSRGEWIVLGAGLLVQGVVFLAHEGPLIQVDSYTNMWEPQLFTHGPDPFHHTPIYVVLIKGLDGLSPESSLGFSLLIAAQHLLTVGMGLIAARTVRLAGRSDAAGCCAGLLIVCCGHLSLYAQHLMSETLSIGWTVLATGCVFSATRSARPARWLIAGGLAAAGATLTRQAMQGWFVAPAIAVVLLGFGHRKRALALYLAGALIPVAALIVHNGVFLSRYSLTAGLGRNLHYRVAKGLPDLTDPDAEPGDPYERARELIWKHRNGSWLDSYSAITGELGWSDQQVEEAFKRFYVEQVKRHPLAFTRVTLDYCWVLLLAHEDAPSALGFHNTILSRLTDWEHLPPTETEGWTARWLHAFQPTSNLLVLFLAVIAPLVVRGRARILAVTAFLSVGYFVLVTSLVELPVPRYRLPAAPFIAIACGLSVGSLVRRLSARWGKRAV